MNQLKNRISLHTFLLATFLFLSMTLVAQDFQGIATYRADRDVSGFQFKGEGMTPDMQEKIQAQLKKQFQKDYELRFNLTESTWKEAESLDGGPATASAGGMMITMTTGSDLSYKNTESKKLIEQTESFSKQFLIISELEEREWEMTGATKKIGNYQAYEAVFENIVQRKAFGLSGDEKSVETISDTIKVTAWYTPEIPVPHGPEDIWGLPGLVLELKSDGNTYLCTKVVLNPDKGVEINVPKKGRKVTPEEYREFSDEMAQKMMDRYSGDDGERVMKISVGGQ